MKNKKALVALVLVFAIVLGGALVLYDRLGQNVSVDRLALAEEAERTAGEAPAEEAPAEETPAEDAPAGEAQADNADSGNEEEAVPPAPDFTVYTEDGTAVRFSDYVGKPIVLNFWASWCGPCQYEMPDFNSKYAELNGEVEFLMVNVTDGMRETVEKASSFIEENGYTFPVFYDTTGEAVGVYGVYSYPTTFFIDAEGYLAAYASGAIDATLLQRGIDLAVDAIDNE